MSDVKRTENEPHDRLTRLSAAMIDALDAHPDRGTAKGIAFVVDEERGGIALFGYDNDTEAMVDLLVQLRMIFKANGKELVIAPLNRG